MNLTFLFIQCLFHSFPNEVEIPSAKCSKHFIH